MLQTDPYMHDRPTYIPGVPGGRRLRLAGEGWSAAGGGGAGGCCGGCSSWEEGEEDEVEEEANIWWWLLTSAISVRGAFFF